ncbi:MAG: hypothetical protein HY075_07830 [Deltaproteobacteria bacterium]|nr:hypothetical protein [Deltaproteobacteria bacterium]
MRNSGAQLLRSLLVLMLALAAPAASWAGTRSMLECERALREEKYLDDAELDLSFEALARATGPTTALVRAETTAATTAEPGDEAATRDLFYSIMDAYRHDPRTRSAFEHATHGADDVVTTTVIEKYTPKHDAPADTMLANASVDQANPVVATTALFKLFELGVDSPSAFGYFLDRVEETRGHVRDTALEFLDPILSKDLPDAFLAEIRHCAFARATRARRHLAALLAPEANAIALLDGIAAHEPWAVEDVSPRLIVDLSTKTRKGKADEPIRARARQLLSLVRERAAGAPGLQKLISLHLELDARFAELGKEIAPLQTKAIDPIWIVGSMGLALPLLKEISNGLTAVTMLSILPTWIGISTYQIRKRTISHFKDVQSERLQAIALTLETARAQLPRDQYLSVLQAAQARIVEQYQYLRKRGFLWRLRGKLSTLEKEAAIELLKSDTEIPALVIDAARVLSQTKVTFIGRARIAKVLLAKLASSSSADVRTAAATALGSLYRGTRNPKIMKALESAPPGTRAIEALQSVDPHLGRD